MDTHTAFDPHIGEIYMMKFEGEGSEQRGVRPGLIFQNEVGNAHSPTIIALPLTTVHKKLNMPTHVLLKSDETGLPRDSMVLCEAPQQLDKERILDYVTTLSSDKMAKVAAANLVASSAIAYIDFETLIRVYKKACKLNRGVCNV